jgi:uncharacterized protein (TIGR03118 family)
MKTIGFSFDSARIGRSLSAALFVAALKMSLLAFPMGSLLAGENEGLNEFNWKNLQSDIAGVADRTDPNLVNSWGLVINPTAKIFWVADNATGVSTLYRPDGTPVLLGNSGQNFVTLPPTVVDTPTPPATTAMSAPTGIVFNSSTTTFLIPGTKLPAIFLWDGEDGGIWGWNPGVDLVKATLVIQPLSSDPDKNSVYKGLALANRNPGGPTLYATNFRNGTVDVFDGNFTPITGEFVDPTGIPAGYAPFGIANIDNLLYVTFALQNGAKHDDVGGQGHGFVDVFTAEGAFVSRLIPFEDNTGPLNSPWGLARVPHQFGKFGHNVLLVGNFGDGMINAFNIHNGAFLGSLLHRPGQPLEFNGLWALFFFHNHLYFTAGIADEGHGLFGVIRAQGEQEEGDNGGQSGEGGQGDKGDHGSQGGQGGQGGDQG